MTTTAPTEAQKAPTGFRRALAGIDGSAEALEAARQAVTLSGEVTLVAVYDVFSGLAPRPDFFHRQAMTEALTSAFDSLPPEARLHERLLCGAAWKELLVEAERERATMIAIGSHGAGRALGTIAGSTATMLVHNAPCSVLVARPAPGRFPSRIVVGIDGSPDSAAAYETACDLADRLDAEVWPVVALGGARVDREAARQILGSRYEEVLDEPVRALVAVAAEGDLLVVGSRGLRGLKSLGSVSERVAHRARSSVLLVRDAPWERE
jgi:nucleotide-binding universal stress UspA family protein